MANQLKYFFAITKIKVQQQFLSPPESPPPYVKTIPLGPKKILRKNSTYADLENIFLHKCLHESIFLIQSPTPLDSMYKLYECIIFRQINLSKAEVRYFYSRSDWTLSTIPDPRDYANLERYAILACIAYLLEYIFHARKGLREYNNSIPNFIPTDAIAEMRKKERQMNDVPTWAKNMPLIKKPLFLFYATENGRCCQICSGWLDKSHSSIFRKVSIRLMDPSLWQSSPPANPSNPHYATEVFIEDES